MATRTWSGAIDSNMNNPANYDGSGDLLTTDDLVFNSGSVDATASANLDVNSITITSNYSGNWSISGYTLTLNGNSGGFAFTSDGPGTLNLGNGITVAGNDATLHIGSGVGTVTANSCVITWNGTGGVLNDDKGIQFKFNIISENCSITTNGSAVTTFQGLRDGISWVMGNNSSATINSGIKITNTGMALVSIGSGCTINGNNDITLGAGSSPNTLPAFNYTGTGTIIISDFASTQASRAITLTGALSSTGTVRIYRAGATNEFIFNQNSQTITCAELILGCGAAAPATFVGNFNGVININGSLKSTTYNNGTSTINLGTSTINCSGNVTFGSNSNINPGISIFNLSGNCNFTSAGKTVYDITYNSVGNTLTFADAPSVHNLTITAGNVTWSGFILTASGNVTLGGTGTVNFGNGLTITGNNTTVSLASTLGTLTGTSCNVICNGTGVSIINNKGVTLRTLTLGNSADLTISGSTNTTFSTTAVPLTFTNGGTLTINGNLQFNKTTSGAAIVIMAGVPTITGATDKILSFRSAGSASIVTIPSITISGVITTLTGISQTNSITLNGNISCSMLRLLSSSGSNFTFNTNNYNINCGILNIGATTDSETMIVNLGSSIITCTSYDASSYNTATTSINFQSSTFNCSGNWISGSNHIIDVGTARINFTGTPIITTAGKALPTISLAGNTTFVGGSTISRMINGGTTPQVTFNAGQSYTFLNYTSGDWNGFRFVSNSPETSYTFIAPAGVSVSNVIVTDCNNIGEEIIAYTTNGNVDGGRNEGWDFTAITSGQVVLTLSDGSQIVSVNQNGRHFFKVFIDTDGNLNVTKLDNQQIGSIYKTIEENISIS